MFRYLLLYSILLFFTIPSIFAQDGEGRSSYEVVCVGFYNLENLFDTIDTKNTEDTEFTPNGQNRWNTERYQEKLKHLAKVIADMGTSQTPDGPALLGVSEIENRKVLEDLVDQPAIKDRGYKIVHHHSPGDRGIDVSLLYQPSYFKVQSTNNFPLTIEGKPDFNTRDLMLVNGLLLGEEVHLLIDHWPSRYGGEAATRPLRNAAAQLTRKVVDSLLAADPSAKIIFMGDLNDDPINESVAEHLNTTGKKQQARQGTLYNPMKQLYKKGIGTLAWRDNWNVFDQIILSPALVKEDYSSLRYYQAHVFKKDYLLLEEGNYAGYPYRSYVGNSYQGGYSDHLPVYIYLIRQAQ